MHSEQYFEQELPLFFVRSDSSPPSSVSFVSSIKVCAALVGGGGAAYADMLRSETTEAGRQAFPVEEFGWRAVGRKPTDIGSLMRRCPDRDGKRKSKPQIQARAMIEEIQPTTMPIRRKATKVPQAGGPQ